MLFPFISRHAYLFIKLVSPPQNKVFAIILTQIMMKQFIGGTQNNTVKVPLLKHRNNLKD